MSRLHKIRGLFYLELSKSANCIHPHLMLVKKTGETICVQCRRTIYMRKKPEDFSGESELSTGTDS
jgi:hypothetical protein